MSDDAQTLLSRATPRRANGEPIENEMTRVNSDVLLAAFDEIERLRARVKELERADRTPRPPEELVGALHDRIHPTSGRLIHSSPIAPPTQEAKP